MSEDVTKLVIQVESNAVADASKRLGWMTDEAGKAERATDNLVKSAHRLVAEYLSLAAVWGALRGSVDKVISAQKELDAVQAKIRGSTQASTEQVRAMYDVLEEMASNDAAFNLETLTNAFVTLTTRGLDPSKKALESYMDIAAGTGQSLDTVVSAVTAAANGMYRGLNQLGIRATQEMDGLVVNYRGQAEKIKGDAASIEAYLQRLATSNFSGAAAAQADTLGNALYRLSDTWDDVWRAVSERGIGDTIRRAVDTATAALAELEAMVASGQLEEYLAAFAAKWDGWAVAAADAMSYVQSLWKLMTDGMTSDGGGMMDEIYHMFQNFPENVRMLMRGIGALVAGAYELIVAEVKTAWEFVKVTFTAIKDSAYATLQVLQGLSNPVLYSGQIAKGISGLEQATLNWTASTADLGIQLGETFENIKNSVGETITFYMDERDATQASAKAHVDAAAALRAEYEARKKAREEGNATSDPLAGARRTRGTDTVSDSLRSQYESLRQSLLIEEQAIYESYQKRLTLIRNVTKEGSQERADMERALNQQLQIDTEMASQQRFETVMSLEQQMNEAIASGNLSKLDALKLQHAAEEAEIQRSYEYRKSLILGSTELTEQQRLERMTALEKQYMQRQRDLEMTRNQMVLSSSQSLFASLTSIAKDTAGEQSGIYKAMFAVSKAFAIAESIIKIQQGIATAAATPWPANLAAMASVAAATASIVSTISGTNFSSTSTYEHGGMIPAGEYGIVGETGVPELVKGPAVVTSARATADRMGGYSRSGSTAVNVHNYGAQVAVEETQQPDGSKIIDVIVQQAEDRIAMNVARGVGPLNKTLQSTFPMRRGLL